MAGQYRYAVNRGAWASDVLALCEDMTDEYVRQDEDRAAKVRRAVDIVHAAYVAEGVSASPAA